MVGETKTIAYKDLPPLDSVTAAAMKEEVNLSLVLSVVYYIFLLSVTILNWTSPALMKTILWGGMSLTWFATSILGMCMATFMAALHVYFYQKRLKRNFAAQNSQVRGV